MRALLGFVLRLALLALFVVGVLNVLDRPAERVPFDLVAFFQTPTTGEGTIRALDLTVDRFAVSTEGSREGEAGRMLERFAYTDGRRRLQDWTLRTLNGVDGRHGYVATRPDLNGPSVFRPLSDFWGANGYSYVWHQWLEPETRSDQVTLRGFVSRQADGSLVNRAVVFKWYVPVAIVRVVFRPDRG